MCNIKYTNLASNLDVRGIVNKKTVLEGQENVQAALLDYTLTCYPSVTVIKRRFVRADIETYNFF